DLGRRPSVGAVLPHRPQSVPARGQGRLRRLPGRRPGGRRARMNAQRAELVRLLDAERERMIAFLQGFARIDTSNPPGDTRAGADYIKAFLDAEKLPYRVIAPHDDKPNLLGSFAGAGAGKHLVLNGHIDVFPIGDRSRWSRDPLS